MNVIKCLRHRSFLPVVFRSLISHHQTVKPQCSSVPIPASISRSYSCIIPLHQTGLHIDNNKNVYSSNILTPVKTNQIIFTRTYKVKGQLKLRCDQCYFVKRQGRLYVECHARPRHKQMQLIPKSKIFKDDYSEGRIQEACFWKYKHNRWYQIGNNKYGKMDWLGDRLGTEV